MSPRSFVVRCVMVGLGVGSLVFGCGEGAMSLTEYSDRLNAIGDRINPRAELLIAELERSTSPSDVNAAMERIVALRLESIDATDELDPPEQIADLHELFLDWEEQLLPIEEALAARARGAEGWEELLVSTEVLDYRAALVEGKEVCIEFQRRLDATAERGVFADTPWLPAELKESVEARLGCDLFPENPESVFSPIPESEAP